MTYRWVSRYKPNYTGTIFCGTCPLSVNHHPQMDNGTLVIHKLSDPQSQKTKNEGGHYPQACRGLPAMIIALESSILCPAEALSLTSYLWDRGVGAPSQVDDGVLISLLSGIFLLQQSCCCTWCRCRCEAQTLRWQEPALTNTCKYKINHSLKYLSSSLMNEQANPDYTVTHTSHWCVWACQHLDEFSIAALTNHHKQRNTSKA